MLLHSDLTQFFREHPTLNLQEPYDLLTAYVVPIYSLLAGAFRLASWPQPTAIFSRSQRSSTACVEQLHSQSTDLIHFNPLPTGFILAAYVLYRMCVCSRVTASSTRSHRSVLTRRKAMPRTTCATKLRFDVDDVEDEEEDESNDIALSSPAVSPIATRMSPARRRQLRRSTRKRRKNPRFFSSPYRVF